MKPKALILTGYGINTDLEMAYAFELVGAGAERVHLNDLIAGEAKLAKFDIFVIPGGFSFADDLGAGKVLAERLRVHLMDELLQFIKDGKLILGVCNGFQVLVKLGLLPALEHYGLQEATLTFNESGRFEDRWVHLKLEDDSVCLFTRGLERIDLPVRHAEGKFVPKDEGVLKCLNANGQVVLRYVDPEGRLGGYPWNPNGSVENIAGICDPTGRVFGLMPHPEAYLHEYHHPRWTRGDAPKESQGLQIFRNAVDYVRQVL